MPRNAMDRLRHRLNLWLDVRTSAGGLRRTKLAKDVGHTPTWLSNVMTGRRGVRVADLDKIADFFRLPVGELVRLDDDEMVEVTPTEKKLLRRFRRANQDLRHLIMSVLDVEPPASEKPNKRPGNPRLNHILRKDEPNDEDVAK